MIARHVALVQADAADAQRHAELGLVYEANGLVSEARASFENASELAPRNRLWRYHAMMMRQLCGDFAGALQGYRDLAEAEPDFAAVHYRLADALLEAGEFDEAAGAFRRTMALVPSAPQPYVGLADVSLRQRDFARAVQLLEEARALDPTYRQTNYLLGLAYRGLGRREEAERELALGIDSSKRYVADAASKQLENYLAGFASQLKKANALDDAGRFSDAAQILERALAIRPNDVSVMINLSVAYQHMQVFQRALDLLLRAEAADDSRAEIYINIVECLLALQRPEEAIPYGEKAAELAPDLGQAHFAAGRALYTAQRFGEAREALRATARLDTQNPEVFLLLGIACARLQQYLEAKQNLVKASQRMPGHMLAHLNLATICIKLGNYEEATAALAVAQRLAPNDHRIQAVADRLDALRP